MIEGLKPYPEYRASGFPWLGNIPAHWEIKRGKSYLTSIDYRSKDGSEELLTVSSVRGVVLRKSAKVTMFKAESYAGYKLCWPGDLVINSLWAWAGGLGVSQHHGIISTAYSVYRPRRLVRIEPRYLHQLVRSSPFNWELQVRSKGIWISRLQLTDSSFLDAPIPLPPPGDQTAIVRFLDHANRKMDAFIRAKRKLIGLLNEQKQAIIHRAVTLGLDPTVPLKPSGIPWLGEIPQHWEVIPLKGVCAIQSGVTLGKTYTGESVREFPYLRVANVQAGHLTLDKIRTIRLPVPEARRSMLQAGDVLMTEGGDPDKLGRGCVWKGEVPECLHQNHVFAVRPSKTKMRPQFLAALLESRYAKSYFLRTSKQTTNLASTNKTTIGQFRLLLPSIPEQDSILIGLASELKPIIAAISRADREIALMQEYRTRLTADIVTGKLDVREAAARLPDLPNEVFGDPHDDESADDIEPEDADPKG